MNMYIETVVDEETLTANIVPGMTVYAGGGPEMGLDEAIERWDLITALTILGFLPEEDVNISRQTDVFPSSVDGGIPQVTLAATTITFEAWTDDMYMTSESENYGEWDDSEGDDRDDSEGDDSEGVEDQGFDWFDYIEMDD